MTASTHDCAEIREQLLDLLYDELDASEAATLRAEVESCTECAEEFGKLEAGLVFAAAMPMEEPSAGFEQRVMAMVHQELEGGGATRGDQHMASEGAVASAIRRLREWVAGPQVAMATLTLLVAALGIWYLPSRREPVGAAGDTVVALEDDGEATATASPAAAAPAEWSGEINEEAPTGGLRRAHRAANRSDDARDRTLALGGIANQDEVAAADTRREDPSSGLAAWAPEPEAPVGAAATGQGDAPAQSEAAEAAPAVMAELQSAEAPGPQTAAAEAPAAAPGRPNVVMRRPQRRGRAPLPSMASRSPSREGLSDDLLAGVRSAEGSARHRTRSAGAAGLDSEEARSGVGNRQTYERGLTRYRAHDYRGAIAELDQVVSAPSPDARSLVPSALHHIAQSLRASGSCGPAVQRYESLLRRFPNYSQAPRAMMEAADCYRRQGQLSAARRWATRAQGYAATASAARRELLRLDSMESGARSRRRPSRTTADVPAAASVEEAY